MSPPPKRPLFRARRRPPQPGIVKAGWASSPPSHARTTSSLPPETNETTRMPKEATTSRIGREIAPQTRVSTPSSDRRAAFRPGGPEGSGSSEVEKTRPDSAETT